MAKVPAGSLSGRIALILRGNCTIHVENTPNNGSRVKVREINDDLDRLAIRE